MQMIHILLVEDDDDDVLLLEGMLAQALAEHPFTLRKVTSLAGAISVLEAGSIDVILLDLLLPDSWGSETVRELKPAAGDVPIIVLTGSRGGSALASQCVRFGARDYISKSDVTAAQLCEAVVYGIGALRNRP